jgi:hypothetical protein
MGKSVRLVGIETYSVLRDPVTNRMDERPELDSDACQAPNPFREINRVSERPTSGVRAG